MKASTLVFLAISTVVPALLGGCAAKSADATGAQEAEWNEAQPGLKGLFKGSFEGSLDVARLGAESDVKINISGLGLYEVLEPIAMGGYYLSERGKVTVDEATSTLTLKPNGGGDARTYDVAFRVSEGEGPYRPVALLLRSANGTFRLDGHVEISRVATLPGSTLAPLDAFAQRFVGRSAGTLDIPRSESKEGDVEIVFGDDGLFQLWEPKAGGGFYLSDRGAWAATAGETEGTGKLTLTGNMGSGVRAYDVQLGEEDGETVALLTSDAGTFQISAR